MQNVAVNAAVLEARLNSLAARPGRKPGDTELEAGVRQLIREAQHAAGCDNAPRSPWGTWWRGTPIEAAYQNLHAAESLIVSLYNADEIQAEIPETIARVEAGLARDDPRRVNVRAHLCDKVPPGQRREHLRKLIEVGYAAADRQHSKLRSFRNIVLSTAFVITVFVAVFTFVVALNPSWVPLCFDPEGAARQCPTGSPGPSSHDVVVIAMLGLLGGTLSAAVSLRHIDGTATPYEVPIALAVLKVPFGAMTAIGAIIAMGGEFIPGLSALDSQVQILAYALVFGYAQQVLTRLVDQRADALLKALPAKDATTARPQMSIQPIPGAATTQAA